MSVCVCVCFLPTSAPSSGLSCQAKELEDRAKATRVVLSVSEEPCDHSKP